MAPPPLLDTNPILRHLLDDHSDHSPRGHAPFAGIESVRLTDTVVFEAAFATELACQQRAGLHERSAAAVDA